MIRPHNRHGPSDRHPRRRRQARQAAPSAATARRWSEALGLPSTTVRDWLSRYQRRPWAGGWWHGPSAKARRSGICGIRDDEIATELDARGLPHRKRAAVAVHTRQLPIDPKTGMTDPVLEARGDCEPTATRGRGGERPLRGADLPAIVMRRRPN